MPPLPADFNGGHGQQESLAASRGTLQEIRNLYVKEPRRRLDGGREAPPPAPSLERFSELRFASMSGVHNTSPWSVPLLPTSLRTLVLLSGPEILRDAPSWLRLAHLTRLAQLTLSGHAYFRPLFGEWDPDKDGPPLPASLAALRLESGYPIDIGELDRDYALPAATSKPLLSARSAVVCCSLERRPRMLGSSAAVGDAELTDGLVSKLPAGFGSLEMHTQCITINCSVALPEACPEDAARELCLFFARAPASYQRFRLFWRDDVPLQFRLSWPLGALDPGGTALARQGRVAFASVKSLAECMQLCTSGHHLSVAVSRQPTKHLDVVRL